MVDEPDPVDVVTVNALAELAESLSALVDTFAEVERPRISGREVMRRAQRCCPAPGRVALVHLASEGIRIEPTSDELARRTMVIESELGEGPVSDILASTQLAVSNDLADDLRWPRFAQAALDRLGVRSVLAYATLLDGDVRAAISFVSEWPYAFDDLTIVTGAIFAQYCTLTVLVDPR